MQNAMKRLEEESEMAWKMRMDRLNGIEYPFNDLPITFKSSLLQ
jgi:hypothetical protein